MKLMGTWELVKERKLLILKQSNPGEKRFKLVNVYKKKGFLGGYSYKEVEVAL